MSAGAEFQERAGGVCAAQGVRAASVTAGLKESGRPDMTLLVFDPPARAAGVYTQNRVCAAPVTLCKSRVGAGPLRAILVNSGVANACTGGEGHSRAERLCRAVAGRLECPEEEVVMASTGIIGVQLPVEKMEGALDGLVAGLTPEGGEASAEAIMTTDTRPKLCAIEAPLPGGTVRLGGMSKGAGMIAPDLATMLAFLTTDAEVAEADLARLLRAACAETFNCITIDGDTSTNDTVLLAATGVSGVRAEGEEALSRLGAGLLEVCRRLALAIVRDGEGVTKVVRVRVGGAADAADARRAARVVAESPLVKTSFFGGLPNWGRIFMAAGRSGARLDMERMALRIGDVEVVRGGAPVEGWEEPLARVLQESEFEVDLELGVGEAEAVFWTTDFSYDYVRINAEYRT
ncbi:MAG: bifunctional glutamate N-acetyltransferase/amino-acid acetyltransferase ArgJ [bacterium]